MQGNSCNEHAKFNIKVANIEVTAPYKFDVL